MQAPFASPGSGEREPCAVDLRDRFAGVPLGTAIGDALGLPMEGMLATTIARRYPQIDRFFLVGRTGFVSDDTEQSALVAQSLARHPREQDRFVRAFQRSLLGWFLRLPWGIGLGTLRACMRIAVGFRRSGVSSAGNGAAMRAAIVGVFFFDAPAMRREWADGLARVTHTDPRAIEGARFVAELAALAIGPHGEGGFDALVAKAASIVEEPSLREALERARHLAHDGASVDSASKALGSTGFVVHTLAITTFCFLRFGHDPSLAIVEAIRAGGDTDTNAAIVGAWMGALHGERKLPTALMANLHDRDGFTSARTLTLGGPTHLRALAVDLEHARGGTASMQAKYSWFGALLRNAALYPIVLMHVFRVFFRR
jgi:ADP-ribosyl-[dinitrogen reductase] hydrolase